MASQPRVLVLVDTNVVSDPRVWRQAVTLRSEGFGVDVIGVGHEATATTELCKLGCRLHTVSTRRRPSVRDLRRAVQDTAAWRLVEETELDDAVWDEKPPQVRAARRLRRVWQKLRGLPRSPPRYALDSSGFRRILLINHRMVKLAEARCVNPPDAVLANDLSSMLAGVALADRFDVPLLYDAHELYPEQKGASLRHPQIHPLLTRLDRTLTRRAEVVTTVSEGIRTFFEREYRARDVFVVRNCPLAAMRVSEQRLERRNVPPIALYIGLYERDRGLEETIRVAARIPRDNARLLFIGFGAREADLRRLDESNGHPVEFREPVAMSQLVSAAAAADIGLVPIRGEALNHRYCLPNKFFEYMAAGLAVVTHDLPEPAALVRRHDVGIIIDIDDPEAAAAGIAGLASDRGRLEACGRRAWEAVGREFNWEMQFAPVIERLRALTGRDPSSTTSSAHTSHVA